MFQADWEDTNRKTSRFQALQKEDGNEDENSGDAMAEDTATSESKTAAVSQPTNPVTEDPAPIAEEDEIT